VKVSISVGGRFWAFFLAQQLLRYNLLDKLITSYPTFEVKKYGIPTVKVYSIIEKELLQRAWSLFPQQIKYYFDPQPLIHEIYDWRASQIEIDSDILDVWSSFGLRTLRKAKEKGTVVILERGSSHIRYAAKIYEEEYDRIGQRVLPIHKNIIEKECCEYEEADYISIPSTFVKESFLEYGVPAAKLLQTPYGVDLNNFKKVPKKDDIFRIIFVGGMTIRKGVHYLLQAFSELKLPDSELLLVGSINDEIKPFFKKYEGNFKWIGNVPERELYKYYSQSSLFVIMSIEEGLALVQVQAMACGLPIICTTNTGGEDLIREGIEGFVINIRDVESLKEQIVYLYNNPGICKEMGQAALERAKTGFTWDDYGEKIINTYHNVLGAKE